MMNNFEEKLRQIMADTFQVDITVINEDATPDTVENWDSLQQLNLVAALETEFDIALTPEDIADMLSYILVRDIIAEKLEG